MRILVINPNASLDMTDVIRQQLLDVGGEPLHSKCLARFSPCCFALVRRFIGDLQINPDTLSGTD